MGSIREWVNPWGKMNFISELPFRARVLDVGCGNHSPLLTKKRRPDIYYVGLDISDCRQSGDSIVKADRYLLTGSEQLAAAIEALSTDFDAVISAHNLEHCIAPLAVLQAMLDRLLKGGRLYLSFPCEQSLNFPSRQGCLNFFDDPTHNKPPEYERVLQVIRENGFELKFATARYRPWLKFMIGLVEEPMSGFFRKRLNGTWALYGFESVICAERTS